MYSTKEKTTKSNNFQAEFLTPQKSILGFALSIVLLALCVFIAPINWQTVTVYGQLGNFDVINHTGHDEHGFEIGGIHPEDVYYSFTATCNGSKFSKLN